MACLTLADPGLFAKMTRASATELGGIPILPSVVTNTVLYIH